MRRREFIAAIGGSALVAWPVDLKAQQSKKLYRIGYIALSNRVPWIDGLIAGLSELGYIEGQNLHIEWRLAAGKRDLVSEMATDLVRLNVDVIVAASSGVATIVKKSTTTIPIVAVATHGGVDAGLYTSLAHPGKNITGLESLAPELDVKRIEMLRYTVPKLSSLAVLYNPLDPGASLHPPILTSASKTFGIETQLFEVRSASEFETVFKSILKSRPDAVISVADPLTLGERKQIVDFCVEHRIPNAHEIRQYVELGGLMSYGASFYGIWHRAAYYVDKILKGTKNNELPVELPTVFDLALNLQAAKSLNVTVPNDLIAIADLVIE